jgi:hypothetical protein
MGRKMNAFYNALGAALGLGVGLGIGHVATGGKHPNVVLATSVAGAAAGAGVAAYVTAPKLQLGP